MPCRCRVCVLAASRGRSWVAAVEQMLVEGRDQAVRGGVVDGPQRRKDEPGSCGEQRRVEALVLVGQTAASSGQGAACEGDGRRPRQLGRAERLGVAVWTVGEIQRALQGIVGVEAPMGAEVGKVDPGAESGQDTGPRSVWPVEAGDGAVMATRKPLRFAGSARQRRQRELSDSARRGVRDRERPDGRCREPGSSCRVSVQRDRSGDADR